MPRGGKRTGAGRKLGTLSKRSVEIAAVVAATGALPLEVMCDAMRYHYKLAKKARADEVELHGMKLFNVKHTHFAAACEYAARAAPYIHPRLNAVEHTGKGGGAIQHEHSQADRDERIATVLLRVQQQQRMADDVSLTHAKPRR